VRALSCGDKTYPQALRPLLRTLRASRPRDQLLDVSEERMNGIPRGTLRLRIWCQRRKSSTCFLERVAAPPEQLRLEALPAQLVELVEMDLVCALVAAKLTPERAEMVEAARHQGREPSPGLVLRLVDLHRQIDITDLERPARIGAEDPGPRAPAAGSDPRRPRRDRGDPRSASSPQSVSHGQPKTRREACRP
jgi:hypothetical protein